tara:strand:+ start:1789 stop:3948 length:2160 start_codon:yes stop_codon:yes gene_type:complete
MKTQNPQIEQTLADMAYEMLQASHPDLFENMVGFQLIDADDQGSKALGMFALKLGSSYAYIPAFFLNGALKPLEILYLKNKDSMVPLSQEWIDLALRDDVGVGYSEKLPSMGLSNPNLEIYATPPRTGRTVTAESKLDVEDFFGKLTKTAESTIPLPLAISLSEGHIKVAFMKMLQSSPEYLEKICEIYPWEELRSAVSYIDKQAAKKRGQPDFKIVDRIDKEITPAETKRILKGKVDIRDVRKNTGTTYHTQELQNYSNPDSEGFYQIPDNFGEEKLYLVMNYHSPEAGSFRGKSEGQMKPLTRSFCGDKDEEYRDIIIVDPKNGEWCIKNRQAVYAKQPSRYKYNHKAAVDTFYKSLPTAKEVEVGEKYIFMKRQGYQMSMVGPLRIEELHWKKDHMYAKVHCVLSHKSKKLVISPNFSNSLGSPRDDTITMSSDIKMLRVSDKIYKDNFGCQSPKGSEYNLLRKGICKVSMATDGIEYSVQSKRKNWSALDKKAAAKVLCLDLDMHGVDALKLMDKVDLEKKASVFVKEAVGPYYNHPMQMGPQYSPYPMAQMTAPPVQSAPYYNAQEQFFHDEYNPMNANHARDGFKVNIGPDNMFEQPDGPGIQESMNGAREGADMGDQLLADAGTIVSLSSMTNIDTLVESYIKDLETALDKLGRMLFLYWWKADKFIEKYHDSDLQETEDSLRNLFRSLGDLIYKFKIKKMNLSNLVEPEEV